MDIQAKPRHSHHDQPHFATPRQESSRHFTVQVTLDSPNNKHIRSFMWINPSPSAYDEAIHQCRTASSASRASINQGYRWSRGQWQRASPSPWGNCELRRRSPPHGASRTSPGRLGIQVPLSSSHRHRPNLAFNFLSLLLSLSLSLFRLASFATISYSFSCVDCRTKA